MPVYWNHGTLRKNQEEKRNKPMLCWVQCPSPIIPIFHYSKIPVFDSFSPDLHVGAEEGTRTPTGTTPH
jgi:hypothetical protein